MIVRYGDIATAAKLIDYDLTDDYLPVQFEKGQHRVRSLRGAPRDDGALEWFTAKVQGLDDDEYDTWKYRFRDNQWMFLAPVFRNCEIVYPLHKSCPLPFTARRPIDSSGATCNLAEADIHSGHCKVQIHGQTVAVKSILTNDKLTDKIVQAEVAALGLVRRFQHEHLIKFIATYSQLGYHHLIFEWANGGNLRELWRKKKPSIPNHTYVIRWAVEQIAGLAEALCTLHNPKGVKDLNCRHGDLKPENIVHSTKTNGPFGILQITDMGLAKVNDQKTMLRQTSGTVGSTIRYQPPEFNFRESSQIVQTPTSRSFDVWSMGCIVLEFVVWLLYGNEELHNFEEDSKERFF
ncbi:kinase-like protein, partial [Cadophora sp. DSE1049]